MMYILTQHFKHLQKLIIRMLSLLSEGENKHVRLSSFRHREMSFPGSILKTI